MWFSDSGGVLHLGNPGAASVPDLRSFRGRVRCTAGKADAMADERQLVAGAATPVYMVTVKGASADAAHPASYGGRMKR